MQQELNLWIKKIFIVLCIFAIGYVCYTISSIIFIVVIAGFITILINPLVDFGEKYRVPAWLTVIGVYIIIIILGSMVIGTLIPIIIGYVSDTATVFINWINTAQQTYTSQGIAGFHFNPYIEKAVLFILGENNIGHTLDIIKQNAGNIQTFVTNQVSSLTSGGVSIVSAVGGAVFNWVLIAVTTFMMVLERRQIGAFIIDISPKNIDIYLRNHYQSIQSVCTSWIKATLILSLSIFVATYIGLSILEILLGFQTGKTFTLALIGGIMEFIPYLGAILSIIPATIIGLGISWKIAIVIIILYISIQQTESNILVPYVMSKSLDLSPFLVFIVMLAGASLGGILGIILAVPITGVARVIYREYHKNGKKNISEGEVTNIKKTLGISRKKTNEAN